MFTAIQSTNCISKSVFLMSRHTERQARYMLTLFSPIYKSCTSRHIHATSTPPTKGFNVEHSREISQLHLTLEIESRNLCKARSLLPYQLLIDQVEGDCSLNHQICTTKRVQHVLQVAAAYCSCFFFRRLTTHPGRRRGLKAAMKHFACSSQFQNVFNFYS